MLQFRPGPRNSQDRACEGVEPASIAGLWEASNFGSNLLREARTKAQESYLVGVVYSTCRVDLNRYLGSGRYKIRAACLWANTPPPRAYYTFRPRRTPSLGFDLDMSHDVSMQVEVFRRCYCRRILLPPVCSADLTHDHQSSSRLMLLLCYSIS